MTDELWLRLYGTGFALRADARWLGLLEQLWAPFLVDERPVGAIDVAITKDGPLWRVSFPDYEPRSQDPWIVAQEVRTGIVGRAFRALGSLVGMHAAVVMHGNFVLVLAGESRAGKTTLLLDLVHTGWTYGSDDIAPLASATGELTAAPKSIQVREPERWPWLDDLWTPPGWMPRPARAMQIPATAFGRTTVVTVRPTHLVFPRYSEGAAPRLRAVPPGEAIALAGSHLYEQAAAPTERLTALRQLCSGVTAAEIEYGSSRDSLQLIADLLAHPST